MEIQIESYAAIGVSQRAGREHAQAWLPPGYTLTGGGAYDLGRGVTNSLTSCYPIRDAEGVYSGWAAAGSEPIPLAVYAVGIRVTRGGVPVAVEQAVFCASSALVAEPGVCARLGAGWIGTGGGARDSCAGPAGANALTSSHPLLGPDGRICGWSAAGKDQSDAEQARVTAFVIGIRSAEGIALDAHIVSNSSLMTGFPSALVLAPRGNAVVVGGGALSAARGAGMLLSATCPVISGEDGRLTGWYVARKVAGNAAPGAITAYSVLLEAA
jgi:hypothetical protein